MKRAHDELTRGNYVTAYYSYSRAFELLIRDGRSDEVILTYVGMARCLVRLADEKQILERSGGEALGKEIQKHLRGAIRLVSKVRYWWFSSGVAMEVVRELIEEMQAMGEDSKGLGQEELVVELTKLLSDAVGAVQAQAGDLEGRP